MPARFLGSESALRCGSSPSRQNRGAKESHAGGRDHLTEHFHEAPVLIVCCLDGDSGSGVGAGASIYPAVQNMLLAARAWDWARR